jgi:hypothetical protein
MLPASIIEIYITDEREVDYWKSGHHICRRVLCLFFLCYQFQGEGQGKKHTFE